MEHLPLHCPTRVGDKGSQREHGAQAVHWAIIQSFVYDPGVVCLLLVCMQLWQTSLLVDMEGKTSAPAHFSPSVQIGQPALPNEEVSGCHHIIHLDADSRYPTGCSRPSWQLRQTRGRTQAFDGQIPIQAFGHSLTHHAWLLMKQSERSWQTERPLKDCEGHLAIHAPSWKH